MVEGLPGWLLEQVPVAAWAVDDALVLQSFQGVVPPPEPRAGDELEVLFAESPDLPAVVEAHRTPGPFEARWRGRSWYGWVRREQDGAVTVVIDVTDRGGLEAVRQFAGGIAHDFNNILTVVLGSARYAAESLPVDSDSHEDLQAIVDAADRAASLTRQLLTFSRQQRLHPERISLGGLVSRLEPRLRREAGPGIDVTVDTGTEPLWVDVDVAAMEQVLLALVRNAHDAIVGTGAVRVDVRADGADFARLDVVDDGRGMTPDVAARAVDPFFTTKPVARTGLGLPTAQGAVHQAGGTVWLDSEPAGGTRVTVRLPRHQIGRRRASPTPDHQRVLVVEDEDLVRSVVVRALTRAGYRVDAAVDAEDALARYAPGDYDLLLTDVKMPGMQGDELAQRMVSEHPSLSVLLMSGFSGIGELSAPVLTKPFTMEALVARVARVLSVDRDD
ncbi:MAG: response regulator [Myxococcota bacterium]